MCSLNSSNEEGSGVINLITLFLMSDVRCKNLRESNDLSNARNRGTSKEFIGICLDRKKWNVYITDKAGRRIYKGRYNTPEEAAHAYDEAVIEENGEDVRLNFPVPEICIGRGIDNDLLELFKNTFIDYDEILLKQFAEEVCKISWERSQINPPFPVLPKAEDIPFTPNPKQLEPLKEGERFIELNGKCGKGRLLRCSTEDYDMLNTYKWYVYRKRNGYESVSCTIKSVNVLAHRLVMGAKRADDKTIDHVNRDTLNVTRDNLEFTDRLKNLQNKGSGKNSTSKYVGVSYSKRDKKWLAYIQVDGKRKFVGRFDEENDAARARNDAVAAHGLNSPKNHIIDTIDSVINISFLFEESS
jgi:hypothetical protein